MDIAKSMRQPQSFLPVSVQPRHHAASSYSVQPLTFQLHVARRNIFVAASRLMLEYIAHCTIIIQRCAGGGRTMQAPMALDSPQPSYFMPEPELAHVYDP